MIENSKVFKDLLLHLQQVPYLASKNIYRVAAHFLKMDRQRADKFCAAIMQAKEHIVLCISCCAWKDKNASCPFCDCPKRDRAIVCVVETCHELVAIEKTGYRGMYHVLGGAISPLDGIGPENLSIDILVQRVMEQSINEVILATNQTTEGEATAAFIAHQLKKTGTHITCLARGVPVGSSLEFMDRVTVYKALTDRRPF